MSEVHAPLSPANETHYKAMRAYLHALLYSLRPILFLAALQLVAGAAVFLTGSLNTEPSIILIILIIDVVIGVLCVLPPFIASRRTLRQLAADGLTDRAAADFALAEAQAKDRCRLGGRFLFIRGSGRVVDLREVRSFEFHRRSIGGSSRFWLMLSMRDGSTDWVCQCRQKFHEELGRALRSAIKRAASAR